MYKTFLKEADFRKEVNVYEFMKTKMKFIWQSLFSYL